MKMKNIQYVGMVWNKISLFHAVDGFYYLLHFFY